MEAAISADTSGRTLRFCCERKQAKIVSHLDKHCASKDTAFTNRAPPCTTSDLQALTSTIYRHAVSAKDDGDAALLNVLWSLFGRSSGGSSLLKSQLAVYPGAQFDFRHANEF
ncbi:hypothetical protein PybrP1_011686 [[Pythium] brassicae (nom. inval.)]|nr:hypothetical protein PybrP1_011686 [[Pythium] brassicae (nom. inval.)]